MRSDLRLRHSDRFQGGAERELIERGLAVGGAEDNMSDKNRILVVGGAGYIGSHCCKALAAAGYRPVCFDNFSTGTGIS
jgi:hypothetical protein